MSLKVFKNVGIIILLISLFISCENPVGSSSGGGGSYSTSETTNNPKTQPTTTTNQPDINNTETELNPVEIGITGTYKDNNKNTELKLTNDKYLYDETKLSFDLIQWNDEGSGTGLYGYYIITNNRISFYSGNELLFEYNYNFNNDIITLTDNNGNEVYNFQKQNINDNNEEDTDNNEDDDEIDNNENDNKEIDYGNNIYNGIWKDKYDGSLLYLTNEIYDSTLINGYTKYKFKMVKEWGIYEGYYFVSDVYLYLTSETYNSMGVMIFTNNGNNMFYNGAEFEKQ